MVGLASNIRVKKGCQVILGIHEKMITEQILIVLCLEKGLFITNNSDIKLSTCTLGAHVDFIVTDEGLKRYRDHEEF